MFKPHFGVNGEYAFRFAQANYLPAAALKFRPGFYDFNAVYEPVSGKRIVPLLVGRNRRRQNCTLSSPIRFDYGHHQQFQLPGGNKRQSLPNPWRSRREALHQTVTFHQAAIRYPLCDPPDGSIRPQLGPGIYRGCRLHLRRTLNATDLRQKAFPVPTIREEPWIAEGAGSIARRRFQTRG